MVVDPGFFADLATVFVAAVLGGALAWWARQPLIVGYVVGGILVSPFTPGPAVADLHTFELFAEIGVVLLMFSIGLEFSLRDLLHVRWVALAGGPLGILASVGLALGLGRLLGWSPVQGVVIGAVVSVASTMVLARLLLDQGTLRSRHGRVMIGITLVEDLAVVVLTVVLPAVAGLATARLVAVGVGLLRAALILGAFAYLARKVLPPVLIRVARTGNTELFLLVTLAIALGTAVVAHAVGLSLALGAFLAGLLIGESDYAHEALAGLLPLRDVFGAVFFVTVGALIQPAHVLGNLTLLGGMVGLVLVGKLVVWTGIVWLFGHRLSTAILVGVGLTQIGEFSFVLVQVARSSGLVGDDVYGVTLATSLLTILVNAWLVRRAPRWVARLGAPRAPEVADERPPAQPAGQVVLCGFGRVGSAIGEALETFGRPYTVVERDADVVRDLRSRGVACVFGDAGHREVLSAAGSDRAALVIVALPDAERARAAVSAVRALRPDAPVLARAHGAAEAASLRGAGATEVVQPELEASTSLIRAALETLGLPEESALAYLHRFRDAMSYATAGTPGRRPLPEVKEIVVPLGTLADRSLQEAAIRERFGVTVVAVTRGTELVANPPAATILRAGDRLKVFGLPDQIAALVAQAERED